jgi:uncharacterized protein YcbK (DUF882 family)
VPIGAARSKSCRYSASRAGYSCGLALLIVLFGCRGLQNAIAEGETRTITMHHIHTDEEITITYKRDGRYDEAALEKLNWFLRDWRRGKETRMDPQLIDLLWEVQRETGSKEPVHVVCGYRSPETNAMLRRRSRGVARLSQHILGHAVDFYIPGVPLEELRIIGLRLQRGGVGFYPTSGSPFVHMDTGGVRMWPRMTRDQLLHVFPDGRTVYLPSDGRPLPGYALALTELKKRGQNPSATWFEEAEDEGLNKDIVAASEEPHSAARFDQSHGMTRADRPADGREAPAIAPAAPAAPAADAQQANALLAGLKREAERRREATHLAAADPSTTGGALYQTASYTATPVAAARQVPAASTPNQIIMARGYWDYVPNGTTGAQAAKLRSAAAAHRQLIASTADATGAVAPLTGALVDRAPPELALAYAQQTAQDAPSATPAVFTTRAIAAEAPLPQPATATTIAIKRSADQVISTIVAAHPRGAAAADQGPQFDSPWLEAVMISPSVRHYLTALTLGAPNYRALASLMRKPASAVVMTFAADPNPGLTPDCFSGSAVVFISTVTYPTHTASLR